MAPHGSDRPSETGKLLLYHAWMSSASRRVRFCLEEKRLPYEDVTLNLQKNEQHSPAYLSVNPNGFVPALAHRGRTVTECTVINEYLDEVFPETGLRPSAPYSRARMRVWTKYVDEFVIRAFQVATWNRIIRPVAMGWDDAELERKLSQIPTPDRREDWRRMARQPFTAQEIEAAVHGIRGVLARMQSSLQDDPWLAGDSFSLADISMAPYIVRLNEFETDGLEIGKFPAVCDWWDRVRLRPGFIAARITPIEQAPRA